MSEEIPPLVPLIKIDGTAIERHRVQIERIGIFKRPNAPLPPPKVISIVSAHSTNNNDGSVSMVEALRMDFRCGN